MKRHQLRKEIKPGSRVSIVLKRDQPTGRRTEGIVKDLLTSSTTHPRGIKVRLSDGQVGRVQEILDGGESVEDFAFVVIHDSEGRMLCGSTAKGFTICLKISFAAGADPGIAVKQYCGTLGIAEEPKLIFSCQDGKSVFYLFVHAAELQIPKLPSAAKFEWLEEKRLSDLFASGELLPKSGELFERLQREFEIDRA